VGDIVGGDTVIGDVVGDFVGASIVELVGDFVVGGVAVVGDIVGASIVEFVGE